MEYFIIHNLFIYLTCSRHPKYPYFPWQEDLSFYVTVRHMYNWLLTKQLQLQNTRMKRLLSVTIFCNFQVLFSQKKENIKTMGMTKSSDDIGNIV